MILAETQKIEHLLAVFRQSDLPPVIAGARSVYEARVSALAALRVARRLGLGTEGRAARAIAEREANAARARWRRTREGIIVMTFKK